MTTEPPSYERLHRQLPPLDDDDAVERWIEHELIALDDRPRNKMWRHRALGMTVAEAMSQPDLRDVRIDLRVPVGEARMLNDAARARGLKQRTYIRRAVGSMLVVCDGLECDDLPMMLSGGVLRPR